MNLLFRMLGLANTIRVMARLEATLPRAIDRRVSTVGDWAVQAIRAGAPRNTGHYASTINGRQEGDVFVISTPEPYGARLEFGFFGTDSMGRNYAQPGRPHFGPVVDALPARLQTEIASVFS